MTIKNNVKNPLTAPRSQSDDDDGKKLSTLKIEYGLGWLLGIYIRKEGKMTLETLKAKAQKREAELKEIKKQVKEAETAELKVQEQLVKLEALSTDISEAIRQLLDKAEVTLPAGKQIITIVDEMGLSTSIVNAKLAKTGKGNGGAKAITFEGQQISWSKLCELKNIARTPSGSAHRDVFNRAKDLHDTIPHTCSIDGKTYPVS